MKNRLRNKFLFLLTLSLIFSCEEVIMEDDISDKEVTLVAPVNNAQLTTTGVSLTWGVIQNAKQYRLQIAKPNFDSPIEIVIDTLITGTSFTTQLNIGDYEWRVQAVNGNYVTSYKSRFFSIVNNDDFSDNTVVLINPANNLITNTATQNLSWQSIIGATSYQVQILDNTANVINDQTTSNTSLSYTFPQGSYQWRVRASNGTDQTLYTTRSVLIDTTNPNTPILTLPATASTTTENDVIFQWNRTPISGSTERDEIFIYTNVGLTNLHLTTQATSPFTVNLPNGTYYWFVKSFDAAGNVSNQSLVFNFTIN